MEYTKELEKDLYDALIEGQDIDWAFDGENEIAYETFNKHDAMRAIKSVLEKYKLIDIVS